MTDQSYQDLKLYGIAIAALLNPNHDLGIRVVCTPIAVPHHDPERIEILEPLQFSDDVVLTDTRAVVNMFTRLVDTLDQVVRHQKDALRACKLRFRPVALEIGLDSRRPVNLAAIFSSLFGTTITMIPGEINGDLNARIRTERATFFESSNNDTQWGSFKRSSLELAKLLPQCALAWGAADVEKSKIKRVRQTKADHFLIAQKALLKQEDPSAHRLIWHFSKIMGNSYGEVFSLPSHEHAFKWNGDIVDYHKNYAAQEKYPRLGAFLKWHPDFLRAFREGFEETYTGQYTRFLKMPIDPPNPFFVDPCADLIRDQLKIVGGLTSPTHYKDAAEWRTLIRKAAHSAAQYTPS